MPKSGSSCRSQSAHWGCPLCPGIPHSLRWVPLVPVPENLLVLVLSPRRSPWDARADCASSCSPGSEAAATPGLRCRGCLRLCGAHSRAFSDEALEFLPLPNPSPRSGVSQVPGTGLSLGSLPPEPVQEMLCPSQPAGAVTGPLPAGLASEHLSAMVSPAQCSPYRSVPPPLGCRCHGSFLPVSLPSNPPPGHSDSPEAGGWSSPGSRASAVCPAPTQCSTSPASRERVASSSGSFYSKWTFGQAQAPRKQRGKERNPQCASSHPSAASRSQPASDNEPSL